MQAYEECISATATPTAPWYVIPADDKLNMRLAVCRIILDRMRALDIDYPEVSHQRREQLKYYRRMLENQYYGFGDNDNEFGPDSDKIVGDVIGTPGDENKSELRRAVDDKRLDPELREALAYYLEEHDWAMEAAVGEGSASYFTSGGTQYLRSYMYEVAAAAIERSPRFRPIYERIFDRVMNEDSE